jgi:hypothetical protein
VGFRSGRGDLRGHRPDQQTGDAAGAAGTDHDHPGLLGQAKQAAAGGP